MKEARPSSSKCQVPHNKKKLDGTVDCIGCGHSRHKKGELCPAKGSTCHACGGSNHFARVCVKSGNATVTDRRTKGKRVNAMKYNPGVDDSEDTSSDDIESKDIRTIHVRSLQGLTASIYVSLNNRKMKMLYDPDASRSVINKQIWKKIGSPTLQPTVSIVAYTNVTVPHTWRSSCDCGGCWKSAKVACDCNRPTGYTTFWFQVVKNGSSGS